MEHVAKRPWLNQLSGVLADQAWDVGALNCAVNSIDLPRRGKTHVRT